MDRRKRYFGTCGDFVDDERLISVNAGDLVTNLLLFDTFIIHSCQLLEIPQLISIFGYDAVLELLESSALKIYCNANSLGTMDTTEELFKKGKGFTFDFVEVVAADHKDYVHQCLKGLSDKVSVSQKQFKKLKNRIAGRLDSSAGLPYSPTSPEAKAFRNLMEEMSSNVPNIKTAVTLELQKRLQTEIKPVDFALKLHQIGENEVQAETNISDIFHLDEHQSHNAILSGLMRLAGISRTLAEMERHTALSGLNDQDFALFSGKFEFLTNELYPNSQINQLRRVMEIKGFPDFNPLIQGGTLNLEKILEIRETKECKEFRDWLRELDSVTDEEIKDQIENIRTAAGNYLGRIPGKSLRWFVSSAIGLASLLDGPTMGLTSLVGGILISSIETFMLQKLFPSSGPISFLNDALPSAFTLAVEKDNQSRLRLEP